MKKPDQNLIGKTVSLFCDTQNNNITIQGVSLDFRHFKEIKKGRRPNDHKSLMRQPLFLRREVMTVEEMKTGFVERIGGTIFVVNAMPAENAKHTQEELVKALIAREAMALEEADVA